MEFGRYNPKEVIAAWLQASREKQDPTTSRLLRKVNGRGRDRWTPVALVVLTGSSLLLLTLLGDESVGAPDKVPKVTTPVNENGLSPVEEAIRERLAKPPEPVLIVGDYLKMAEALLSERGFNENDFSFRELMAQYGYQVGPLQTFGPQAIRVKAGQDGHLRRRLPTIDPRFGDPVGVPITRGEIVPIYATEAVLDTKSGVTDHFGLTDYWRVTQPPELSQLNSAPNILGDKQYEPSWIRLGRVHPSGKIESFLDPEENIDLLLSGKTVMVSIYQQKYLKDGKADYGNGVIGPSLADQARFN